MVSLIAAVLEYTALGVFLLWVLGYVTHIVPRCLAGRIARRETEWSRDTVETDRLSLYMTLLPFVWAMVPCLFRLVCGIPTEYTWVLLIFMGLLVGAILFQALGPQLSYDAEGLRIRGGNGKEYLVPWHRVISVEWQSGGKRNRKRRRSKSRTPTVAIRYQTELFGKPISDVYTLDPTRMRGIRRFLAEWESRLAQEAGSAEPTAAPEPTDSDAPDAPPSA